MTEELKKKTTMLDLSERQAGEASTLTMWIMWMTLTFQTGGTESKKPQLRKRLGLERSVAASEAGLSGSMTTTMANSIVKTRTPLRPEAVLEKAGPE